jgi:diguanylate cyclase (GGDEF)-like protein
MERLAEELKRLRRQGQPLALAIVDLDHFKSVNDTHGHLTGDRVLVETAAVLQSSVRETDLAGRLGGEEFGLLMPGTDLAGARQVAERVRWHLAAPAERFEGKPAPRVTASIGLTVVDPTDPEQTLELLLARADALLYRAKREGRDRVCAD